MQIPLPKPYPIGRIKLTVRFWKFRGAIRAAAMRTGGKKLTINRGCKKTAVSKITRDRAHKAAVAIPADNRMTLITVLGPNLSTR